MPARFCVACGCECGPWLCLAVLVVQALPPPPHAQENIALRDADKTGCVYRAPKSGKLLEQTMSEVTNQRRRRPAGPGDGACGDAWHVRFRHYLRPSCCCEVHRTAAGRWILLKPMSVELAEQALAMHNANVRTRQNMVKDGGKRLLTRVAAGGTHYLVKQFNGMRFRGPWRTDRLAWLNHHRFASLGMPACACYGWLNSAIPGRGFLILEDLGETTAADCLVNAKNAGERRPIVELAACRMGQMHIVGVDHCDLKLENFMVDHSAPDTDMALALVDLDRVHFYRTMTPRKRRLRNLDQVLNLLSKHAAAAEGMRFLAQYRRVAGGDALDHRTALDAIRRHWGVSTGQTQCR